MSGNRGRTSSQWNCGPPGPIGSPGTPGLPGTFFFRKQFPGSHSDSPRTPPSLFAVPRPQTHPEVPCPQSVVHLAVNEEVVNDSRRTHDHPGVATPTGYQTSLARHGSSLPRRDRRVTDPRPRGVRTWQDPRGRVGSIRGMTPTSTVVTSTLVPGTRDGFQSPSLIPPVSTISP